MNDPLATIGEVAASLVQTAAACPQNELALFLQARAATLRCAVASIKRAAEAAAKTEGVQA
jgi:hypothetical protein